MDSSGPEKFTKYPGLSVAKFKQLPREILDFVKSNSRQGDPDDVLRVIDDYCYNQHATINVGDVKGTILDKFVTEVEPLTILELGSYLGYGAVRIARLLKPGAMLYTVEVDAKFAEIAREMVAHAGLSEKVTVLVGASTDVIPTLVSTHKLRRLDFVFIDHSKELCKKDLIALEQTGLVQNGSVVVADNVIFPGCPEYLEYVRNSPKYRSELFKSTLEYKPELEDGMERSVYLG